jgi:hypothetical protein
VLLRDAFGLGCVLTGRTGRRAIVRDEERKRRRSASLLALWFLLLPVSPVLPLEEPDQLRPPGTGWKQEHREDRFAVYSREALGTRFRENLLVGVLDHPPEACFRAATDYESYPAFMPYCRFTRIVDRRDTAPGVSVLYVFLYLDVPVLSNRYLTSKYLDEQNVTRNGIQGCYVSSWESVMSGPFHRTPASPDLRGGLPSAGGVEIAEDHGTWLFQPLAGGRKTRMVYREWSDPGGRVPAWINNIGGEASLKSLWEGYQARLSSP